MLQLNPQIEHLKLEIAPSLNVIQCLDTFYVHDFRMCRLTGHFPFSFANLKHLSYEIDHPQDNDPMNFIAENEQLISIN